MSELIIDRKEGEAPDLAIMCSIYLEPNSFVRFDSKIYDLNTILKITNTFQVVMFPIRELSWLLDGHYVSSERVEKADLSYPIIISELRDKFIVLDGVHRLAKAIAARIDDISIKFISPDLFTGLALPSDHSIYTYDIEHEDDDVKDLQVLLKK